MEMIVMSIVGTATLLVLQFAELTNREHADGGHPSRARAARRRLVPRLETLTLTVPAAARR